MNDKSFFAMIQMFWFLKSFVFYCGLKNSLIAPFLYMFVLYRMTVIIRCALLAGVITSYGLWLDGALLLNSSSSLRFFVVEGLSAWSQHVVRLQACTARGCGKGPMVSSLLPPKATNHFWINEIICDVLKKSQCCRQCFCIWMNRIGR